MNNSNIIKNQAIDFISFQIMKDLNICNIGSKENLIEKGLSSIMIMKISNKLRGLGIKISFAKLMEKPTMDQWKQLIENTKITNSEKENSNKIVKENLYEEEFQLTDVQYAYWVGRQDNQILGGVGCHAYLEIDGKNIDKNRLRNSWNALQNIHPMLRAKFTKNATQIIMQKPYSNEIGVYDLKFKSKTEIEEKLQEIRGRLSHRKLNVECGEVAGLSVAILPNNNSRIFLDVDLLVADVMSLSIIIDDLAKIYNGVYKQHGCEYTFKNYIQEKKNDEKLFDEDKAYWKDKIKSLPKESPSLPLKKKPEFVKNVIFNRRKEKIDKFLWEKIKKTAENYKVTPSMVLMTCYSLIIERWTNQDKFIINIPLFNRDIENDNLSRMVADFTNILLVDYERKDKETFSDTVKRVSKRFLENAAHSKYSGVQVQRDMYQEIGSNNNIAPIVFACNIDYSLETKVSKESLGKITYMVSQTPQVWLDFQTYMVDEGIILCWDSVEELYPKGLVDDMFSSLVSLIYNLASTNDWNVVFDVLPKNQMQTIKREIQDVLPLKYSNKTLCTEFIENVEKSPDSIAVICGKSKKEITYKELYDQGLKIAEFLINNGVEKGDYIGIILPRGVNQIYAILGILFTGSAYVPIEINQPKERKNKIYKQVGIKYIISNSKTINDFSLNEEEIMIINMDEIKFKNNKLNRPTLSSSEDVSYVIMTSGTTGTPKGVEICHKNAMNTILDINSKYGIGNNDSLIMISGIDFDLSVYDIFGLLSAGGKIIVLNENNFKDPDLWIELISKYKVTLWNSVPILFDMLITRAEGKNIKLPLKTVMLSGDWIVIDLPNRFYKITNDSIVIAMGGATEASIWSNYLKVPRKIPKGWISIPYGKPLKNQIYRVVDDLGRDCPNYVKGELLIGGSGVAKGYRGDKNLTDEKFIMKDEIKWYKTGDIGITSSDRTIEFLGRKDSQVKIKGHRIELGEIEAAIKRIKFVIDVCVALIGSDTQKEIVAYVCTDKKNQLNEEYIKSELIKKIPDYMLPIKYLISTKRILSDNGKFHRQEAIKSLEAKFLFSKESDKKRCTYFKSYTEKYLAGVWKKALKKEEIYALDNYFKLGGDSLKAVYIINELKKHFKLESEISIKLIFEFPTIEMLAKEIDRVLNKVEIYEI